MAVDFKAVDDERLRPPAASNYGLETAFTLAGWIKPDLTLSDTAFTTVFEKPIVTTPEVLFGVKPATGVLFAQFEADSSWQLPSTDAISDNVWSHIAVTYDDANDEFSFFINGVKDSGSPQTTTTVITEGFTSASIGARTSNPNQSLDGLMEDWAIWNRELLDQEIANLGKGKLVAGFIPKGLSAWWPMHVPGDAVYGGTVLASDYGCLDFSGNGHDIATINATPTWENDHPGLHWPTRPMVVPFMAAPPAPSTRRVSLGATYIDSSRVVLAG